MNERVEHKPQDWAEGRRLRAWDLHEQGWPGARIAEALGVTRGAVSQWLKRAREGGREALYTRTPPGVTARLTAEHRAQLPTLLTRGAEAYGFVGQVWTARRVAVVIFREFGVRYHPTHVGRLLRALGLSPQKPVVRASKRNEAAVTAFREEQWPSLQVKPSRRTGPSSASMRPDSITCPS